MAERNVTQATRDVPQEMRNVTEVMSNATAGMAGAPRQGVEQGLHNANMGRGAHLWQRT